MKKEFTRLVDEILEFYWESNPIEATFSGIHRYDQVLDKMDSESRKKYRDKIKNYLERVKDFPSDTLSSDQKMDQQILLSSLKTEVKIEEETKKLQRDSSFYPRYALWGPYILMLRNFAPLKERMKAALARLEKIPAFMEQGKANLKKGEGIPKIWTETGLETTSSGKDFFDKMIPIFAEKVPEIKQKILDATHKAKEAFESFETFLKQDILPESDGDFAVGKELFDYLLSSHHMLPYDSEEVYSIGEKLIGQTQKEMEEVSKEIDPQKHWTEIVKETKRTHPEKDKLLEFYKKEMEKAKGFVMQNDLVAIPPGENLEVIETPVFERNIIPYGAYMPPAPFEEKQEGFFWVTPVNENFPQNQQEEQLEGHNSYGAVLTALHEAYPGHHLQLVHSNRIDSKVRRLFGTSLFWEGWALYCEDMMYEQGFYTDPRTRLLKLKDQLWRGCRVVIDVGIHTGKMSFDQAVDMLVNVAKLEPVNARAEVKRYTTDPAQPLSYSLGKMEILKLRDEYKKLKGADFDLKSFHNKLLSYGSIPIKLVREKMLET
ncbi:MAG: hypothetical protein AMJ90_00320 [candidate division Zixibacteria bacterium SM23_73_2]|nr:MAG: hypothetical protein AMJ90_00320 [candidate division Zixibacteria bacterium SM23_73_2]